MIPVLFLDKLSLWNVAWQSTLFAVIGLAGSFILRRRPARASQILFLAIIAAVLLPVLSVLVEQYGLGVLAEKPIVLPSIEEEMPAEIPENLLIPEIYPAAIEVPQNVTSVKIDSEAVEIPWRLIVLGSWMVATLIMLGRLIIAFVSGITLLRRAKSDTCEHIRPAADSARARLGITKDLKIRSSRQIRSPMIWCWNRPPILLVPDDFDGQINWVDVICHELAHWKRWDHVSGLIAELAVCVLPWNPLLWWSKKRMVRLSEQVCDDWVLAGGRAGADYAQSLLNLSPDLQMAFMPTVIGKEKPMKERIYRIVKEKCGVPYVGLVWALVVTIIAASLTVGVALAQRGPARFERPQRDQQPAAEQRERQDIRDRMADLRNQAHELKARMDEVRAELAKIEDSGKGESDEAQSHRAELRELEKAMAPVKQELQVLESQLHGREIGPDADQGARREMLRRLEELGHETEMVLQGLTEQNFGRNEEAKMLYGRMRELNEQMQQVRQQLGRQFEGPDRQKGEFRREGPSEEKMRQVDEMREKARQIKLELKDLGDENPERAEKLNAELREIHDAITQIERDVNASRERGEMRQMRQRELQEHAQKLEHRLQEIGDSHPEEAQEIRMQLDKIHQQMERIEREPGISEQSSRIEEPMQPGDELHRKQLMARREQLQAQLREIKLALGELNEQGKGESEEAQIRRQRLRELLDQLNEIRRNGLNRPQEPGRDDLEREVQDLRKQMDSVNQQMGEMRELMKKLLEKSEPPKAG